MRVPQEIKASRRKVARADRIASQESAAGTHRQGLINFNLINTWEAASEKRAPVYPPREPRFVTLRKMTR